MSNDNDSWSQLGEDIIVYKYFGHKKIKYLDIGCYHPTLFSNTYMFFRGGGQGSCIDPNHSLKKLWDEIRPSDEFICGAVSAGQKSEIEYFCMSSDTLNTTSFKEAIAVTDHDQIRWFGPQKIENRRIVKCYNVNVILERLNIDFLSIDIEGSDYEILRNIDFKRFRPSVICAETRSYDCTNSMYINPADGPIGIYMNSIGYKNIGSTSLNTIYADCNAK